jgi:uncharacterized protein with HEPN domain
MPIDKKIMRKIMDNLRKQYPTYPFKKRKHIANAIIYGPDGIDKK